MNRIAGAAASMAIAGMTLLFAGCSNRATMAAVPIPMGGNIAGKIASLNAPAQHLDVVTDGGALYHINAQHATITSDGKSTGFNQLHQGSDVKVVAIALDERTLELQAKQVNVEPETAAVSTDASAAQGLPGDAHPTKARTESSGSLPSPVKRIHRNPVRPIHLALRGAKSYSRVNRTAWAAPVANLDPWKAATLNHAAHPPETVIAHPPYHHTHPEGWDDDGDSENPPTYGDNDNSQPYGDREDRPHHNGREDRPRHNDWDHQSSQSDDDAPPPLSDAEIDRRLGLPPDDSSGHH